MELIYLWVEKYKNIEKQGFNFSSKYKCKYDDKSNELTIDENKDYIDNFFGENINVTAIVGMNGSGKSSIINAIINLMENRLDKSILVFKKGEIVYYYSEIKIETTILNGKNKFNSRDFFVYNKKNHEHYAYRNYNILEIDKQSICNILSVDIPKEEDLFELSTFMYLPTKIEISLRSNEELIDQYINFLDYKNREEFRSLFIDIRDYYYQLLIIEYIKSNGTGSNCQVMSDKSELLKLTDDVISESDFNKYFLSIITKKIFKISELSSKEKKYYFSKKGYFSMINVDLIDERERRFNHLSHGEQMIFGQLLNIYFFSDSDKESLCFLFDEPEIALHPNWQKNYINELIQLFKKMNKKYQLVFTSHSPFLLSDIPKQNIIFLDKEGNGNCKVVDGLKEKQETFGANIHTLLSDSFFMEDGLMGEFAKNKINDVITILNRKKISKDKLKYCKNIISIIGEPILKKTLELKLNEHLYPQENEIDKLKREKEDIDKKIKLLEDDNETN